MSLSSTSSTSSSNLLTREFIAARIAMVLFGGMAAVQILVAVGVVPVTILWGWSQKELTGGLRLSSLIGATINCLFAAVVYTRSSSHGVTIRSTAGHGHHEEYHGPARGPSPAIRKWTWVIFAYMCLNTVGNMLSQNIHERTILMTSVTIVLAVCCFIVASSKDHAVAPTLSLVAAAAAAASAAHQSTKHAASAEKIASKETDAALHRNDVGLLKGVYGSLS
jgi:hypothetical protein